MLQDKDINKISELKHSFTHSWVEADFIFNILKTFSFSKLNKSLSFFKTKGYSFEWVLSILISMPFMRINTIHKLSGLVHAKKDVFYRVKNNSLINWRFIMWLFAVKFNETTTAEQTNDERVKCLIFDDTTLEKTGKFIEKTSFVWDHVKNRCVLGFKLLLMGYWDGVSFIPLDFSLHREKGKNEKRPFGLKPKHLRKQYSKKRKPGTHAYHRAREADETKIAVMLKMLDRAVSKSFKIDYVLVDSWFTCHQLIEAIFKIKNQKVHLIGMYKNAKALFGLRGKQQTYSQIRNRLGKPKRCRSLKLYYHQVRVDYQGYQLQLFFSRQGKSGKWKVLLSTDTSISFIRMIEIYQTRWTIEVFFKETKQLLNLGRCQSNDFDAHIADLSIIMIQYMLLSLRFRYDTYETKGLLFEQLQSQIINHKLNERLWGLFIELLRFVADLSDIIDFMDLYEKIICDDRAKKILTGLLGEDYIHKEAA